MKYSKLFISIFLFFIFQVKASLYKEIVYADAKKENADYVLGVDVGGTNTDFGFFAVKNKKPVLVLSVHIKTKDILDFTLEISKVIELVKEKYNISVQNACIGAPGARSAEKDFSTGGKTKLNIEAKKIKAATDLQKVIILNDFEVIGYGVDLLAPGQIIQINKGTPKERAPKAVVGAGTGLGTSFLIWNDYKKQYFSVWSELGAVPFCPADQDEFAFVQRNIFQTGRISDWNYVLGGVGGIEQLYDFFALQDGQLNKKTPEEIFGGFGSDPLCTKVVEKYLELYARFARIATFAVLPYGGLYIAGGVVAKNADLFQNSNFLETFFDNTKAARKWELLRNIPIYLIADYKVSLYGAAQYLLYEINT